MYQHSNYNWGSSNLNCYSTSTPHLEFIIQLQASNSLIAVVTIIIVIAITMKAIGTDLTVIVGVDFQRQH